MTGRTITIIVLILIVIAGLWWYFSGTTSPTAYQNQMAAGEQGEYGTSSAATTTTPSGTTSVNPQSQNVTVTYTANGFSPASVTIPVGATVTWVNQSSDRMWVASGVHPTHTLYDGTNLATHCAAGYTGPKPFDSCAAVNPGSSYSFTFTKAGTWQYHNHADSSDTGTVVVTGGSTSGTPNGTL